MRTALAAAAAALLILGPGAAGGGAVVVDAKERYAAAPPVLTGDGIAYSEEAGTYVRVRLASRGRRRDGPLVTPEVTGAPEGHFTDSRGVGGELDASERAAALTATTVFRTPPRSGYPQAYAARSFAGPDAGSLRPVSPVCPVDTIVPALGVDGSRAVTTGPACGEISVLDLATGERRLLPVPAGHGEVRIAGRYAAWLEPDRTSEFGQGTLAVVVDDTGREVMRTAAPVALNTSPRLELDDEGTIALYGTAPGRGRPEVITATLADPVLRAVAVAPGTLVQGARLAGGRLALLRTPPGENLYTGSEVVLMSPRGEDPRTVLRGADGRRPNALDFDGRQIAAHARGCRRGLYVRHPADGPAGQAPAGTRCPLRLVAPLEVTRRGLEVRLSCSGFIAPCEVRGVQLRLGGPRGRLIARSRRAYFTGTFTLRLPKPVRRRLVGKRVTLTAELSDLYGGPFAAPPRSVTARVAP